MSAIPIEHVEEQLQRYHEQLWAKWDEELPRHFYHYTSVEAMRKILNSGVVWATDIRYVNDTSEKSYCYDVVLEALHGRQDILSRGLMDNFDEFGGLPGYGEEWFRYAVCFCGTKDLLSQWGRYTPSGGGVALSISVPALQKYAGQEFALIRMLYDVHHQTQLVNHLVNYALGLWEDFRPESHEEENDFLGHLGYIVIQSLLRFKHPAFAQEDEWRVLLITWARDFEAVRNAKKKVNASPISNGDFGPSIWMAF